MFQSTLLRRTMTLVIGALVASTFLTLVAFLLAGRNVSINNKVNTALEQTSRIANTVSNSPEIIEDKEFRKILFESSFMSDKDVFLLDGNLNIIEQPSPEYLILDRQKITLALSFIRDSEVSFKTNDGISYVLINSTDSSEKILITMTKANVDSESLYLCSLSAIEDFDDVIISFLNILALSTLLAALAMLIPSYIMVNQIIMPIQNINEVAKQFGAGNMNVRADESHKGEIGELGASFNILADRQHSGQLLM